MSLCEHFPPCGGCRLQDLPHKEYVEQKRNHLLELLGKNGIDTSLALPTITSEPLTRRRARLAASNIKGKIVFGFNQWHSHDIVDLNSCRILDPKLMALITKMRPHLKSWLGKPKAEGDVQITLLDDGTDAVFIGGSEPNLDIRQDFALMAEELDIAQLSWRKWDRSPVEPIAHRKPLSIKFGEPHVSFPPASFLQATKCGETALIDFAAKAVKGCDKILDLFCGLGGFGLSMPEAINVNFAELDGPAITALSRAVVNNPRYKTQQRDLIREPFSSDECNVFDVVIFDPPRGGAKAQAQQLSESEVKRVVAISCDPPTFARDARILINGGYYLQSVQPIDQFLWSTHMELAAHFVR